ncbi:MAG TPA: hypothetical protein VF189_00170 [Patescibacteria group bacterium]
MKLLFAYLVLSLVLVAFVTTPYSMLNFFGSYYYSLWIFFTQNFFLCIFGIVIALVLFFRAVHLSTIFTKPFVFLFQLLSTFFVASFLGIAALFLIAFFQLNTLAIILDANPTLLNVELDKKTIFHALMSSNTPPNILATQDSKEREVVGIAQNMTGTDNFYGSYILPRIPNFFILPIERNLSSMILADNTLIFTKIDKSDLQEVAPILGYSYVKQYFPDRNIRQNPKILIMTPSEYIKHRQETADKRSIELDSEINLINDKISSLSAGIENDKTKLDYYTGLASDSAKTLDDQYRKCINAGEYKDGKYVHYYSDSYCVTQKENFVSSQTDYSKDVETWTNLLSYDQNQIRIYKEYVTFFKNQKDILEIGKNSLPDELGSFNPPNEIQLDIQTSNSHSIADFVETLVHEFLHYASYNPNQKLSSSFFEEGLTEYFARRAVQDNLHISTNLGYPAQVRIIEQITKRIDESELADIYFSKDQNHLEQALNRVYGDNFYSKNISLFNTLMYTSDTDLVLEFSNRIMKEIGGTPLTKRDLISTESDF